MSGGYSEPCSAENTIRNRDGTLQCRNTAVVVPKQCRPGTSLGSDGWCREPGNAYDGDRPQCPDNTSETPAGCAKLEPIACPAGSTPYMVFTSTFQSKVFCVPNTTIMTRARQPANPTDFPCSSNEFVVDSAAGFQCLPPATSTTSSPTENMNLSEIEATYQKQLNDYESTVTRALETRDASKIPEIRSKAEGIQITLNKMIEELTYLKKETPNIRVQRDELIAKLQRIQKDYSAILVTSDDLETLRRIRQQEGGEAKRELFMYIGFFLVLAIVILLFLIFMSPSQKKDMATSSPNTPVISPTLT